MSNSLTLTGHNIYASFLSGYENLLKHKKLLNDINVFPVPDGDTGSNMVSTVYSTIQLDDVTASLSETLNNLADKALSGARGNSGIILAQFLNGLAAECENMESMTTREFGAALRNAAKHTYSAIENPKEGTLITLLRVWSEEMYSLGKVIHNFNDLFLKSIHSAKTALEKTKDQLSVLKKADVVDAGALGFVAFLEGVARMIATGAIPEKKSCFPLCPEDENHISHDIPESSEAITFRYCAEALILNNENSSLSADTLKSLGDSLIISKGKNKTKIHIHTNNPAEVFFILKDHGRIIEQKVDDMLLQYNSVHNPVSKTAIVTDSIADIPREIIDKYQIHVIPQKILWGDDEYLDRVTITPETFYPYLDEREDYPSSSIPDPRRTEQVFEWLSAHYDSIIAIPVAKALSGTWQVMENSSKKLKESGYPVSVIDSRLNSAAEGLAVISAAKNAALGMKHDEIISNLNNTIENARILVSVATFKYMIRGGRVSALKGFIAAMTNLKPVISLDSLGKGIAFSASFSQAGSQKKILKRIAKSKKIIRKYAVVHAACPEKAAEYAEKITAIIGHKPEYIMEISPIVGIHAGIGAVAVAWI